MGINAEYMGTSPHLGVSGVHCTMRAVVLVLLGAVAINAEAEADPLLVHHTGVGHTVAGVYNAHIPGVHHVAGVHPVHSVAPVAPVVHAGVKHVAGVYSHPFHYNNYIYGKREAEAEADPLHYTGLVHHTVAGVSSHPHHFLYGKREAEAEAEPYTIGQVYAGLPVANAIATGHPHNVGVITNMVSPVHHSVHHPYMGYGFYG